MPTASDTPDIIPVSPLKGLDQSQKLAHIVDQALEEAERILALPLDREAKDFAKILSTKQAVIASVLATQTKVDENRLRFIKQDRLVNIIAEWKKERAAIDAANAARGRFEGVPDAEPRDPW